MLEVEQLTEELQERLSQFRAEFGRIAWPMTDLAIALEGLSDGMAEVGTALVRCRELIDAESARKLPPTPWLETASSTIEQAEYASQIVSTLLGSAVSELMTARKRGEIQL